MLVDVALSVEVSQEQGGRKGGGEILPFCTIQLFCFKYRKVLTQWRRASSNRALDDSTTLSAD